MVTMFESIGRALIRLLSDCVRNERGQGTVEAAFIIPVMFTLVLMLIQPGVILYDRIVMNNAAAEGCRLLATSSNEGSAASEQFIRHRLASIPPQEFFHVHDGNCSWEIGLCGSEDSETVSVTIRNQVKPLPLLSLGGGLLGITNEDGNLVIEVSQSMVTQPEWARNETNGSSARGWAGAWMK